MTKAGLVSKTKPEECYFSEWDRNLLSLIHELSGPLTAASLNLDKYVSLRNPASLDSLSANIKLMADYLNNARLLIKNLSVQPKPFNVNQQLNSLIKNLSPIASRQSVTLKTKTSRDSILIGNPIRFKQIISCFILNAIDAYDGYNQKDKQILVEHYSIREYLVISVLDYGSGINEVDKTKIFKPYYSTKSSTGLGLGLSLAAESIAQDFNGFVKVKSSKNKGAAFSLFFKLPDTARDKI